jgi:hypothetical protein
MKKGYRCHATAKMFVSGYGNFAAVTFAGRLFCLLFGIIGIPFMLSGQQGQGKVRAKDQACVEKVMV